MDVSRLFYMSTYLYVSMYMCIYIYMLQNLSTVAAVSDSEGSPQPLPTGPCLSPLPAHGFRHASTWDA